MLHTNVIDTSLYQVSEFEKCSYKSTDKDVNRFVSPQTEDCDLSYLKATQI